MNKQEAIKKLDALEKMETGYVKKEMERVWKQARKAMRDGDFELAATLSDMRAELEILDSKGVEMFTVDENGLINGV